MRRLRVLVRGAGEHASATAHRLHRCGMRVAMTEVAAPTAVRRAVAFCSAVWDGEADVEGVRGALWHAADAGALRSYGFERVAVFVDPGSAVRRAWRPDVVVDARILKRNDDTSIADAPLVVALGPGYVAGRDAHVVVETNRGHDLGRLIHTGQAAPDTGVPGDIAGVRHERVLRAPAAGVFEEARAIGDRVAAGDVVGRVEGAEVRTAIAGVLRGLVRTGVPVTAGLKVGDVDPRGDVAACFTLSDKARTISGAVLEAVFAWEAARAGVRRGRAWAGTGRGPERADARASGRRG